MGPFIVIRTFAIRKGKLDAFRQSLPEFFKMIEAKEPRLLALNAYVNEEGTETTFVHVHPDAASMERHEEVAHEPTERLRREFLDETFSLQVYGEPSMVMREKERHLGEKGIALIVKSEYLGGFIHLAGKAA